MKRSQPAQRRTQAERTESTRAKLIAAAIECLNEYGYAGTTTQKISERADVTRGALNHHFKDRNDLLIEVCDYMYREFVSQLRENLKKSDSILNRLKTFAYAAWSGSIRPSQRAYLEILMATKGDPAFKKQVSDVLQRIDTQNLLLWLDAFSDLPVPQDVLTDLRDQIFYLERGMAIMIPYLRDDGHFEQQIDLFCEMADRKIGTYIAAMANANAFEAPRKRRSPAQSGGAARARQSR